VPFYRSPPAWVEARVSRHAPDDPCRVRASEGRPEDIEAAIHGQKAVDQFVPALLNGAFRLCISD